MPNRTAEDVRTNPIKGDVALSGEYAKCEVTAVEPRWIRYKLTNPKATDAINSIPMEGCRMKPDYWRTLMADAEVLHIAQVPHD